MEQRIRAITFFGAPAVDELGFIELIALPPNKGMQLTIKSVTPFAYAKAAPLLLAADPRRYATGRDLCE